MCANKNRLFLGGWNGIELKHISKKNFIRINAHNPRFTIHILHFKYSSEFSYWIKNLPNLKFPCCTQCSEFDVFRSSQTENADLRRLNTINSAHVKGVFIDLISISFSMILTAWTFGKKFYHMKERNKSKN